MTTSIKAVVFAAGLGTRLRPLTDTVPKPLIEIGGKPILARTLEALPASVSEVIVVVGYKADMIREYLEDSPQPSLSEREPKQKSSPERGGALHRTVQGGGVLQRSIVFVDQPELRGTYDALLRAAPMLDDRPFLVLNGDDLYAKEDLERLAAAEPPAMLTHRVPTPNPYSHLESENGFLQRIVQNKDATGLAAHQVYAGASLLDGRFFKLAPAIVPSASASLSAGGEFGLPQTLAAHHQSYPVRLIESRFWLPVGTPQELEAARRAFGN